MVPPDTPVEVTCLAKGFPPPKISMRFQECPEGPGSCGPAVEITVRIMFEKIYLLWIVDETMTV